MKYRTKLTEYLRQRDRGWMLSLSALALLAYMPYFGNQFIFDDMNFFSSEMLEYYKHALFHFDLRWLPYASLSWTAALFSDVVPHLFHLGNALLHISNVIILFYLIRKLFTLVIENPGQSGSIVWGAWLAALLFAVHPVAVYAVGYVIQRSILMATFFTLLMQLAYLRALLTGQKRWLLLVVIAYFMAGFSKEHSVLVPAVLLAIHVLLKDKVLSTNRLSKHALWWCWSALVVIGVALVLRAKGVLGAPYEPMAAALFEHQAVVASTPMLHLLSAFTQAGLYFKYLLLWLLPNPAWMSVDMREHFISSLSEWQGWAGGLAYVTYGVLAFRLLLRGGIKGLAGLALLYPWLLFMVEMTGVRVQEPFVLYRSYLWMPGLMLFVPLLVLLLPGRRTIVVLGLYILFLLPLTWNRLWVFGDSYRLWNDAVSLLHNMQVAGADRIYFNRGLAYEASHNWQEAATDFERVIVISPKLAPVHYQLGMAYMNLGRFDAAVAQFDSGIRISPTDGRQYLGKGMALMRLHQREQSQQQMKIGCELGDQTACMIVGLSKSIE